LLVSNRVNSEHIECHSGKEKTLITGYYLTLQAVFRKVLSMGKRSVAKKDKLMALLFEYLKDSNKSDKQLAKTLGVSQPTVSRMRNKLLTEGIVRHFSVFPNFGKMGYEIMAFSCAKFNMDKIAEIKEKAVTWAQKNPEIIFTSRAQGMGMDAVAISIHKNYADYDAFIKRNRLMWGDLMTASHNMLIDLKGEITKPLSLKYLAENQKKSE
jgi:DNA-binding Lrp family transcriptional regulator